MEFGEKLQKLRKENNWTQSELADKLYISRTAVSKWESGKCYPNIDLLKNIATIFDKPIDDLLSTDEILDIAKTENINGIKKVNNLIYGLIDTFNILFIFLPLYSKKTETFIYSVSLINENDLSNTIKILYIVLFLIMASIGLIEIIINFSDNKNVQKIVNISSIIVETISILIFSLTRQVYLTTTVFVILIIKILVVLKNINIKNKL